MKTDIVDNYYTIISDGFHIEIGLKEGNCCFSEENEKNAFQENSKTGQKVHKHD